MNEGTLQLKNDRFLKIDEGSCPIDGGVHQPGEVLHCGALPDKNE